MKIRLLRHAAMILEINGTRLLLDPMLSPAEANAPIPGTPNPRKNPLVPLPVSTGELEACIGSLSGALITHTHGDHFDNTAAELLPKDLPMLCQPSDTCKLTQSGFTQVLPVRESLRWKNLTVSRTRGRHGRGVTAKLMGKVSGYFIGCPGEPSLYITGDTVWCKDVEAALEAHRPDIVIVFAGAAQFVHSAPITMDIPDMAKVCEKAPQAAIIAVHMEALNHCVLTREMLKEYLKENGLEGKVLVPADGEWIDTDLGDTIK